MSVDHRRRHKTNAEDSKPRFDPADYTREELVAIHQLIERLRQVASPSQGKIESKCEKDHGHSKPYCAAPAENSDSTEGFNGTVESTQRDSGMAAAPCGGCARTMSSTTPLNAVPVLNGSELAGQPWTPMHYIGNSPTTSHSIYRRRIVGVFLMDEFLEEFRRASRLIQAKLATIKNIENKFKTHPFIATNELMINVHLRETVYHMLERLFEGKVRMSDSIAGYKFHYRARADGYCFDKNPDGPFVVAVIEVKKSFLLGEDECLAEVVQNKLLRGEGNSLALDACQQAAGQAIEFRTQFGFITTYGMIWAYKLGSDGIMYLSPGFRTDVSGDLSGLNLMYYWLNVAMNDPIRMTWVPPKLARVVTASGDGKDSDQKDSKPDQTDAKLGKENQPRQTSASSSKGMGSKGQMRRKALATWNGNQRDTFCPTETVKSTGSLPACDVTRELATLSVKACVGVASVHGTDGLLSIQLMEVLAEQRDRITWRGQQADGTKIVVKAYDLPEFRDTELECYDALEELQGLSVPLLLWRRVLIEKPGPRCCPDEVEERVHAFALSWAEGPGKGVGEMQLRKAREILSEMHARGVTHGDVHPRNMAVHPQSGQVVIFDFSHAMTLASLHGDLSSFAEACADDMLRLDKYLGRVMESKAAAADEDKAAVRVHHSELRGFR